MMAVGEFVPTDLSLPTDDTTFILLTGPNMSGISTVMRQVALIALMAQIGSFVPASEATIGLCDRIFTRVGASDNLSEGQSTFMVEMTETANILHNASSRSLVILDEIGRGTSTFDGISIAWAVAEHLHEKVGCRTLFATHYHELTELDRTLSQLRNMCVSISEINGELHFLHRLIDGSSNRSYGIQVARLAGLPRSIVRRSQKILKELEQGKLPNAGEMGGVRNDKQLSLFVPVSTIEAQQASAIEEEIRQLDIDQLSPMAALQLLHDWQGELQTSQAPDDEPPADIHKPHSV
jgi:DNA mismatch repair protein MutS